MSLREMAARKEKPSLLDVDGLADKLGVKRSWVYEQSRLSKYTNFPVLKFGKYLRFDFEKVQKWAEKHAD